MSNSLEIALNNSSSPERSGSGVGDSEPVHDPDRTRIPPEQLNDVPQPKLPGEGTEKTHPISMTQKYGGDSGSRKQQINKRKFNRPKPHEQYEANQQLLSEMFTHKQFKKYFIIHSKLGNNLAEINVIKANKQLTNHLIGKPNKITEL